MGREREEKNYGKLWKTIYIIYTVAPFRCYRPGLLVLVSVVPLYPL